MAVSATDANRERAPRDASFEAARTLLHALIENLHERRAGGHRDREVSRALAMFGAPAAVYCGSDAPLRGNDAWRTMFGDAPHLPSHARFVADRAARVPDRAHRAQLDDDRGRVELIAQALRGIRCCVIACRHVRPDALAELDDASLAAVSHQLRTPLATLFLWEQILRSDGDDPAMRAAALDAIHASVDSQAQSISALVDRLRGKHGSGKTSARASARAETTRVLAGARVLVVEDDANVRRALGLLVHRAGAVVDFAATARDARKRIAAKAPDAVVCDISIPGEDGCKLVESLRATGSTVPAIAMTGSATKTTRTRALAAGFDRYLVKPFDSKQLVAELATLLQRRGPTAA